MKEKKIGNLTILEILDKERLCCKCDCGKKVIIKIQDIQDKRKNYSCGCLKNKKEYPLLYRLWNTFSEIEKAEWGSWILFVKWAKSKKYNEIFSYYKVERKKSYSKDNLQFGLFINKNFFSIEDLSKKKYFYNEKSEKFVTNCKIKNITLFQDEITKSFNKQKNKHKKLSQKNYKLFLQK